MLEALNLWLLANWPLLAAAAGGWLLATLIWAWRNNGNVRRAHELGLAAERTRRLDETRALQADLDQRQLTLSRAEARLEWLEADAERLTASLNETQRLLTDTNAGQAALKARLEESRRAFAEKEALFKDSSDALKKEFELLARQIFDRQGQTHQQSLNTLLTPFREQITDFRRRVDEVYTTDAKERASLLTEVRNLQSASERINKEAENLTRALKGDTKLQGNWGELVLERVLENSGLRRGEEYFVQESRRDQAGDLKRPDVIIRLPEDKDVIIDAKVSLTAYEEAVAAEDAATREQALRQHCLSLRQHVKRLSEQGYDQLEDVRSLDFVLMFVPIESAFTLALEAEPRLFSDAFAARIVVVSPTTLMMTLRIIHNVWRYEKQSRNAQEIARRAGALYDKLRGLVEDMEQLGRQLATVDKTFQSAQSKLSAGKGNLVRQVERFRELGAVVKKPVAKSVRQQAMDEDLAVPGEAFDPGLEPPDTQASGNRIPVGDAPDDESPDADMRDDDLPDGEAAASGVAGVSLTDESDEPAPDPPSSERLSRRR